MRVLQVLLSILYHILEIYQVKFEIFFEKSQKKSKIC